MGWSVWFLSLRFSVITEPGIILSIPNKIIFLLISSRSSYRKRCVLKCAVRCLAHCVCLGFSTIEQWGESVLGKETNKSLKMVHVEKCLEGILELRVQNGSEPHLHVLLQTIDQEEAAALP